MNKPRRFARPSLTPMIDVVFLLLLFFLITSQFGSNNVLKLDTAFGGGASDDSNFQLLEIGNVIRLNGVEISPSELKSQLTTFARSSNSFALRPSKGTSFGALIEWCGLLREAGIQNITLVDQNE